ncbi:hypothetical protein IQ07DRAFT_642660 [Pyrenochaeta sp. DS3sAY3a]|nr:hypothetical protein IQ07DRAFT_642660 [Pyrenochaeta sp. DS3sAY3a]
MSDYTLLDIPFGLTDLRSSIIDLPPGETCYVCMRPFGTQDDIHNPLEDPACDALRLASCPHVIGSHCFVTLSKRGRLNCSMCAVPMKIQCMPPMHPTIMWVIGTPWFKDSFNSLWDFMVFSQMTWGMAKTTDQLGKGKATIVQAVLLWMRYVMGLMLWKLCCHITMLLSVQFIVAVFRGHYESSPFLGGIVSGMFLQCAILYLCNAFMQGEMTWPDLFAYIWGTACTQHIILPECAAAFEVVDYFLKSTIFAILILYPMVWKPKAD